KYLYERGEGRFKHCWNKPEAGFSPPESAPVGKCSSKITDMIAQTLLDEGVEYRLEEDDPHPSKIYNVFEGVPYEAAPTRPGISYHGYPWRGPMPRWIYRILKKRADDQGHGSTFKAWLKKYGTRY